MGVNPMRTELLKGMTTEHLVAFARDEQGRADFLQSLASKAQRAADRARKEIKRRKREARA